MKNYTEEGHCKFLAGSLSISIFLALAALEARKGNPRLVFIYTLFSWTSYMISHKAAVGQYIDDKESIKEVKKGFAPKEVAEHKGFLLGSTLFISGMTLGAYGLHLLSRPLTLLGSIVFITGYVVAHYSTTGELL